MSHNGGRSLLGPFTIGGGGRGAFPFLNFFKTAQPWVLANTAYPQYLTDNGYLASTPSAKLASASQIPNTVSEYTGDWIVDWQGYMKIEFPQAASVVSSSGVVVTGTTIYDGTNGTVRFTLSGSISTLLYNMMDGNGTASNARLYRADQATNVANGETWNPDFLTRYLAMNPGVLRFMDWQSTNGSDITKWAHRGVAADFSYGADRWLTASWGGTIAGTNTYTGFASANTPVSWTDKEIYQGFVTHVSTGPSTLNIGARGPKTIVDRYNQAIGSGTIAATSVATFVYDADLDKAIYFDFGLSAQVPYELLIDLCNAINAHGYFNIPFYADDDYVTQGSTLWKNTANAGLIEHDEYSNEIWNDVFSQTALASAKGFALYGVPSADYRDESAWYAHRFMQIWTLIDAVYAGDASRHRSMIGAFAAGSYTFDFGPYRFDGQDLGLVAPNRPRDKCYGWVVATYYKGVSAIMGRDLVIGAALNNLKTWADLYATGVPANMTSALDSLDDDIRNGVGGSFTLAAFEATTWPKWHAPAVVSGRKVMEYEAAAEFLAPTAAECTALAISTTYATTIANLYAGYKHDERFENLELDRYNAFLAQSNGVFPAQYGDWGDITWTMGYDQYVTPYKNEEAIQEINAQVAAPSVSAGVNVPRGSIRTWSYR